MVQRQSSVGRKRVAMNHHNKQVRNHSRQHTVHDLRAKLTSVTGTRPDFDHELILLFARNRMNATYALPLFSIIIAFGIGLFINMQLAITWGALVLSAYGFEAYMAKRYEGIHTKMPDVKLWTRRFTLTQGLIGLSWSILFISLLWFDAAAFFEVITFSIMLVIVASGAMLSYSLPLASFAGTAPVSISVAAIFGVHTDLAHLTMGFIAIGAQIFFMFIAKRMHKTALAMLEARAEKDLLIGELEEQRGIAEDARCRAEEANLAKSKFLATMSHELRTPLNAILGFSEVMSSEVFGPLPNDHYKNYVMDIHRSGKHLLNLINEILDLSRIEAGKHELNEEAMQLEHVVEEAVHLLSMKARTRNITLDMKFEQNLPKLWVDERAIRQITLNILSNALKFTPEEGSVFIRVGWTADDGQYLSIKDTGPGIPEDEIATVLSNFGQGTLANKSAEQGTGLGLPIIQALVDMHDGQFEFLSEVGTGTEVICVFPKHRVMEVMPRVKPDFQAA